MSFADVTTSEMELTPCRVSFQPPGATAFIDLGGTLNAVTVSATYNKAEIKADQSGETVRDRRVSGIEVKVTTALAETQILNNWKYVFPHATQLTGGTGAIEFRQNIGDSDLNNSGVLLLHPLSLPDSDLSKDHTFYKACAEAASEILFSPTDQQMLSVVWNVLPDESVTGQAERFYRFGDSTVSD